MSTLDFIGRVFLFPNQEYSIVLLLIVGFWGVNQRLFGQLSFAILGSLVLNLFLKSLFQVPLPPELGKAGWAFPSGHMQSFVVIYGWLAWESRRAWARWLFALWFLGGAWALTHFNYHYWLDPFGALFFGGLWAALCRWRMNCKYSRKHLPWYGVGMALLLSPLLLFIQKFPAAIYLVGLIAFSLGWGLYTVRGGRLPDSWRLRGIYLLIAFVGAFLVYFGLHQLKPYIAPIPRNILGYAVLCFFIGGGAMPVFKK